MDTTKAKQSLSEAQTIVVIQAENPDGDSLGSALARYRLKSDGIQVNAGFCGLLY